jgi:hypothetical protein
MRLRHRASAASLLSRGRSGCCADLRPPLLPTLRRKSLTGADAGICYQVGWELWGSQEMFFFNASCAMPWNSYAGFPLWRVVLCRAPGGLLLRRRAATDLRAARRRCSRAASDMRLCRPLLRRPRSAITALICDFVTLIKVCLPVHRSLNHAK